MTRSPHHPRSAAAGLVVLHALVVVAMFLTCIVAVATRADDSSRAPRCSTVSSKGGDFVPAGSRPCTVYGTGQGSGHASAVGPGVAHPVAPDTAAKKPGRAPAAAPKAAAPPKVSLSKR
ncbi:hypothetical protein ACH4FX_37370 [Streptomyces sp. NPDC018019]|uniref:hypothetical protein n=1 Tax=Streptomyces sp. NPDC018019 TaxID=3365030 RepID=UPI0037992FA3